MTSRPRILAVTGIDGSGKTTIATWLEEELVRRGYKTQVVWSRFNNFVSRPFLLVTRLTGHNFYESHAGVRMGYHKFQKFPKFIKWLFVWLQIIDVNIANKRKILAPAKKMEVTICERGPWDTLVDVASDTEFDELSNVPFTDRFMGSVSKYADILLIDRDLELIRSSRAELEYDDRIEFRKNYYRKLAGNCGWGVLENNRSLDDAQKQAAAWLDELGY